MSCEYVNNIKKDLYEVPGWLSLKCLPSGWVMILESWGQAPHWAPCSGRPASSPTTPTCVPSLTVSLSVK